MTEPTPDTDKLIEQHFAGRDNHWSRVGDWREWRPYLSWMQTDPVRLLPRTHGSVQYYPQPTP